MQTRENHFPDWVQIEDLYIAGGQSIRELARQHQISDTAIHKRAKAEGWKRGLQTRIGKRKPAAQPRRAAESALPKVPDLIEKASDADPAELIKETVTETIITLKMLQVMLRALMVHRDWFEQIIYEETEDDRSDRRREALEKAVSVPTLILAGKNLSLALKTLETAGPGKKERAQDEAVKIAGGDSDWGSDLSPPGSPVN